MPTIVGSDGTMNQNAPLIVTLGLLALFTAPNAAAVEPKTDDYVDLKWECTAQMLDACGPDGSDAIEDVGTPWSSSSVSPLLLSEETCGSESHWKITAEVLAGDADGGAKARLNCGEREVVDCEIAAGGKSCTNELTEIEAGAEGSLECGAELKAGSEDANIDVECVDPPMPGEPGRLIKTLLGYDSETGSMTVLAQTIEILPAL